MPASQFTIKNQFVAAVGQLAALPAPGDEGLRIRRSNRSIRCIQWTGDPRHKTMLAGLPKAAEVHVARGTVYLIASG